MFYLKCNISSVIELTYDKIDFIADIMSNGCKLPLPIVYVSKIFGCDGYEVDVESLADNLAGIAYVIIEKTSDIADMLKIKIGKNPYNGTIGIYYPNGSNEKIKPNEKNKIIPNIEKSVTAMVDKLALTWLKNCLKMLVTKTIVWKISLN